MKPARHVSRLVEIMAALREPKTGCPWDLEQDFRSIAPYTLEEVYEVIDAIERDDMDDLREELGDLLLQVIYHARLAQEAGSFDLGDVVETVTAKMIRRHPHVFGDDRARSAGMAKGTWERIKAQEKAEREARRSAMGLAPKSASDSLLDDVPRAMPGLLQALKLQQKMARVGFDWNDPRAVVAKVREELDEVEEALDAGDDDAVEDELGDLFFTLVNLARHRDIDPDQALRRCNAKVRARFAAVERTVDLDDTTLDEMEAAWQAAKGVETA